MRLGDQSSATLTAYKSFQAGTAARLSVVAALAGAVSTGLGVASMIVQTVHDLVRDAIADVLGKLISKGLEIIMTAGVGTAAAIASLVADVSQWTTRLSREVKSVVTTSSNLGDLFRRARIAIDDLAATAEHGLASLAGQPATAMAAAGGTRGARGASRSAHGARGGRGAGTGHNGGTGGTGGGKGHGGAGDGGAGGTGHGTAGGDKTPDPEMIRRSQEAQQRAQNTKDGLPDTKKGRRKATSSDHNQTLSGWSLDRPSGFQKPNVDEVLAKQEEIGHPVKRAGASDHGVDGQYYASHAERQESITAKEPAIGVAKELCDDCPGCFSRLAQHEGRCWYVTDPDGTWIFYPDGTVVKP